MTWTRVKVTRAQIDTFKRSWPCHGFPDNLNTLHLEFDSIGDLVDMEARARNGRRLDTQEFDGPALVALTDDYSPPRSWAGKGGAT